MIEVSSDRIVENGVVLPWYSPHILPLLEKLIRKDWKVFEYGAGISTYWWSLKVSKIVSVEHDWEWFDSINKFMIQKGQKNFDLLLRAADKRKESPYTKSILETETKYDCIILDGMQRHLCASSATKRIKKNGIIILDDADRESYRSIVNSFVDKPMYKFKSVPSHSTSMWIWK